jgi:hypothetical protein
MMGLGGAAKKTELMAKVATMYQGANIGQQMASMELSEQQQMNAQEADIAVKGDKGQGDRLKAAKAKMGGAKK